MSIRIRLAKIAPLAPALLLPGRAWAALPQSCREVLDLLTTVANAFSAILFPLSVIIFLVSAFYFLTTGGNEEGTKKAKSILVYAIIGLVVALFAFVLPDMVESLLKGTRAQCP